MPGTGVEPALPYGNQPLKLARLPIPPPGPFNWLLIIYYCLLIVNYQFRYQKNDNMMDFYFRRNNNVKNLSAACELRR